MTVRRDEYAAGVSPACLVVGARLFAPRRHDEVAVVVVANGVVDVEMRDDIFHFE